MQMQHKEPMRIAKRTHNAGQRFMILSMKYDASTSLLAVIREEEQLMTIDPSRSSAGITRRQAFKTAGKALAGLGCIAAVPSLSGTAADVQTAQAVPTNRPDQGANSTEKLRIATCQFPVSGTSAENAKYIRGYIRQAAAQGAHLLHTSEASLSGYAGSEFTSFENYDWDALRRETAGLKALAGELKMWLALGSSHFLDEKTKPTNCIYLISPEGRIADRYDKSFCTATDQQYYSAGNRLVTREIRGVKIGLAICYDICWPQLYIAYRELGATVMVHSMYNARAKGKDCLDTLNMREVPTRCADNRMWAVVNNSSQPYSHWGSFIARPDATIAKQLEMNVPGMLVHDFPDTLSEGGWYHNFKPMKMRGDEIMSWGTPSDHPRQRDGQSEA
jgi:predicted amidohydrolase